MDRRLLAVIIDHYDGGPVGVDTLAAALAEPRDTLEDVVEPFLLQQGYVGRTPRGRIATRKAYEALEQPPKAPPSGGRRSPGRALRVDRAAARPRRRSDASHYHSEPLAEERC